MRRTDDQLRTERGDIAAGDGVQLLPQDEREKLHSAWERVQVGFVDEPRTAVRQAHDLVGQLVDSITVNFTRQRDELENTWSSGNEVSTEDLRLALQRYRALFNRLLET